MKAKMTIPLTGLMGLLLGGGDLSHVNPVDPV